MRRRTVCVLVVASLLVLTMPSVAYADVSWQDQTDRMTAVVAGYPYTETGRCSALMEYLGFDWSTIGSKQRQTLLSDRNRDNPFTQSLAQVYNVQYETNDTLNWPIISVWATIFGLSEQWDISLTLSQYQDTQEYVQSILTGKPTGGGGGEPEQDASGWYRLTLTGTHEPYTRNTAQTVYVSPSVSLNTSTGRGSVSGGTASGTITWASGQTLVMYVDPYSYELVTQNGKPYVTWIKNFTSLYVVTASGPFEFVRDSGSNDSNYLMHNLSGETITYTTYTSGASRFYRSGSEECVYFDNADYPTTGTIAANGYRDMKMKTFWTANGATGVPAPTVPTPEPDPPVTPPTPPTGPTFTFDPTIAPSAGDPDFTEITDWLRLIYNEEVDIEATFTEVMNNLGTDLAQWFQQLNNSVTGTLEWAVEEIEFYLDSFAADLFGWMRRIVSRMGGTGVTKPDPTTDEKGFWEWLLERILDFFAGDIVGAVNGLKNKLTELTQLFPFSLPWDLMGLLALFAAQPVTPVFDVAMPVPSSVSGTYGVGLHVDLHQWDGTMVIVRGLEKIFFAAWLITMFPQWLDDMKIGDSS